MGFSGGTGHVWKTTNAGASWTDYTANLPDSPVNAVIVDVGASQVYVATDVGVFASATSTASWTELGPNPLTGTAGALPNVAVTALAVFSAGGVKLVRASTYGRGIWQFNLDPDTRLSACHCQLAADGFLRTNSRFQRDGHRDKRICELRGSQLRGRFDSTAGHVLSRARHTDSGQQYSIHRDGRRSEWRLHVQRAGPSAPTRNTSRTRFP